MTFTLIDLILLIIITGFVTYGVWLGFVEAIGGLLGLILGIFLGGKFAAELGDVLSPIFFGRDTLAEIVAFILIFTIASRLVGIGFYILNKVFKIFSLIPFVKTFNRMGGGILGFVEGVLVVGVVLSFTSTFTLTSFLSTYIATSKVALGLIKVSSIFTPLIPEVYEQIKNYL